MSKQDKRLAQMANNPREDLQAVADANGIEWAHDGGSHVIFREQNGAHLSVPAKRPIKPVYIKQFIALIKRGV
jgi:predicted RNA binding protein YcfA (HicA-like mRNA interferase family)